MTSYQRALFVDEHRDGPAPFADRRSDLLYLLVGMSAGITGVWDEFRERPALDLIRWPRKFPSKFPFLARAHSARTR